MLEFEWKKLIESEKIARMNKTLLMRQLDANGEEIWKKKSDAVNKIFMNQSTSLGPILDSNAEKM